MTAAVLWVITAVLFILTVAVGLVIDRFLGDK